MGAVVAIVCLLGVLLGDPGTVKRTPSNCFPLPEQVALCVLNGRPLPTQNIGDGGREFCVRCLVWRPGPHSMPRSNCDECCECMPGSHAPSVHHCSTCNRCVTHFDHH